MKIIINIYLFIFSFIIGSNGILDSSITLDKKDLLILPTSDQENIIIADKVLSIISSQASSIGRFNIIDRNIILRKVAEIKQSMDNITRPLNPILNKGFENL